MRVASIVGALFVVLLGSACTSAPAKAPPPPPTPMKLPADATAIDFTLTSGSCWGISTRSRTVALRDEEIVIAAAGFDGESKQPRAWWEETRSLLDEGLANATGETTPENAARSTCFSHPNFVCKFELHVTTPRGDERLQGCCSDRAAHNVEAAFHRLAPTPRGR